MKFVYRHSIELLGSIAHVALDINTIDDYEICRRIDACSYHRSDIVDFVESPLYFLCLNMRLPGILSRGSSLLLGESGSY